MALMLFHWIHWEFKNYCLTPLISEWDVMDFRQEADKRTSGLFRHKADTCM